MAERKTRCCPLCGSKLKGRLAPPPPSALLAQLPFNTRILHTFTTLGLATIGDLLQIEMRVLRRQQNFGRISMYHVSSYLWMFGLSLKGDTTPTHYRVDYFKEVGKVANG